MRTSRYKMPSYPSARWMSDELFKIVSISRNNQVCAWSLTAAPYRCMRFCLRLLACLLALAWVPITQHCELAALGWLDSNCRSEGGAKSTARTEGCTQDDCSRIEKGGYKLPGQTVSFADLSGLEHYWFPQAAWLHSTEVVILQEPSVETPLELGPTWSFERRGALFPRAPSIAGT